MYRIGIDVGGTKIAAGLVGESGEILSKAECPTLRLRSDESIIADMAALVKKLAEGRENEIKGIGIGVPGSVYNNIVLQCVNMRWRDMPLGEKLQAATGYDIRIGNDANCAMMGEYRFGACQNAENAVMLTLGTGVGGGLIIGGKLYVGSRGYGAELGHLPLVFDGIACPCGGKGCIEQYCSATALIRMAEEACRVKGGKLKDILDKNGSLNAKNVMDAVKGADETANAVFNQYIRYLAAAVNGLINAFDPDVVAIGGGVSNAGEILLDALKKELKQIIYIQDDEKPKIVLSANGNDAGILGAAALVE